MRSGRPNQSRTSWWLVVLAIGLLAAGLSIAFIVNRPSFRRDLLKDQEQQILAQAHAGRKVTAKLGSGQAVFYLPKSRKKVPAAVKQLAETLLTQLPQGATGKAVVVTMTQKPAPLKLAAAAVKFEVVYQQKRQLHHRAATKQLMLNASGKRAAVSDLVSDDYGRRALDYAAQTAKAEQSALTAGQLAALMREPLLASLSATNFRLDDQHLTITDQAGQTLAQVPTAKIAPYLRGASAKAPSGKLIALTFDDGPDPRTTPAILKTLAAHHIKATFFQVGSGIAEHPALAKQVKAAGHEVGTHTYSHPFLPKLAPAQVLNQTYGKNLWTYYQVFKTLPPFIRPPFGAISKANADLIGMPAIQWSVDSQDWKSKNRAAIIARVKATAQPGGIVLMHDIQPAEVAALPTVIANLQQQGYQFVTVSQLLGQRLMPGHQYFGQGDERLISQ